MKLLFSMFAIAAASALSATGIELIAHRGASYDAPENTAGAAKLAFIQGADGTECDVYLTKDGKVMVMHDGDTMRTAGVKHKMALATSAELSKIEVGQWGKWKGSSYSEKVPFLSEILATVPQGKKVFVEIKCDVEVLPQLEKELAASPTKNKRALENKQIAIICFNYNVIKAAKARMPQYEAYWLVGQDRNTKQYMPVEEMIAKVKAAGLDGLDLNYGFPIDKEFVQKVHKAGLKLYTWTVDDPAVARAEVEAGVDGITTNRPEWLRQQLSKAR